MNLNLILILTCNSVIYNKIIYYPKQEDKMASYEDAAEDLYFRILSEDFKVVKNLSQVHRNQRKNATL